MVLKQAGGQVGRWAITKSDSSEAAFHAEPCDVLIAGGGPAGLAAGLVLAKAGLSIVICEPKAYPIDKACGEGIMPSGVYELCKLGVDRYLSGHEYAVFKGIRYHSYEGSSATGLFAEGPGWGIERVQLSRALRQRVSDYPNIKIVQSKFTAYQKKQRHLIIETDTKAPFQTRLLIGADGLHSRVRRWAALEDTASALRRWGLRRHFQVTPWSDYVEVYWSDGIEAYMTPCGPNLVEVAFVWHEACLPDLPGGEKLFNRMMALFPSVQSKLDGILPHDRIRSAGPLHQRVQSPVADGVLLIGDAAGYLDAITGEGISLALIQVSLLKDTIIPLLKKADKIPTTHDLQSYRRAYNHHVRLYYLLTHLALFFSRHPQATEKSIRTLAEHPAVFRTLLTLNMGRLPAAEDIIKACLRLTEGMLR